MNRLSSHLRNMWVLWPFFICFALLVLLSSYNTGSQAATTAQGPEATATPTCSPTGCAQARRFGYQPYRYDMRPTFVAAASNSLPPGTAVPYYNLIKHGLTPTMEPVSAARPISHVIQRGMAWHESHWTQFGNSVGAPENSYACTLVGDSCGYGVMQITSCMNVGLTPTPPPYACGWFEPSRVAGELTYNIGTGTNFLIHKWDIVPSSIDDTDNTVTEQWYY